MYTADNICKIIEFLIDNIFVQLKGCLFSQVIRISVGRNCAPLLVDLSLFHTRTNFRQHDQNAGTGDLQSYLIYVNLCNRYIDD